jgi:hypothetical protein
MVKKRRDATWSEECWSKYVCVGFGARGCARHGSAFSEALMPCQDVDVIARAEQIQRYIKRIRIKSEEILRYTRIMQAARRSIFMWCVI